MAAALEAGVVVALAAAVSAGGRRASSAGASWSLWSSASLVVASELAAAAEAALTAGREGLVRREEMSCFSPGVIRLFLLLWRCLQWLGRDSSPNRKRDLSGPVKQISRLVLFRVCADYTVIQALWKIQNNEKKQQHRWAGGCPVRDRRCRRQEAEDAC